MKIYRVIKPYIKLIITLLVILVVTTLIYMTINVDFKFDDEHIARLALALIMQVVLIGMWLSEGKKYGKENEGYKKNAEIVGNNIQAIDSNKEYDALDAFCEYATAENIKIDTANICARHKIDYIRYCNEPKYANDLTEKQKRIISKAEQAARRNAEKINATEITSCSPNVRQRYDVTNRENESEKVQIAIKLAVSIITALIGAALTYTRAKSFREGLTELFYWLTIIASTIYFSINTGYTLITETRNDYFKRLIDFFKRFNSWKFSHKTVTKTEKTEEIDGKNTEKSL